MCRGDFGRLGHGDSNDVFMPQQIAFFSGMPIKQVACGDTHTLAITDDGALYSFGRNQNGQLGHGNTSDVLSPKLVEGLKVSCLPVQVVHIPCHPCLPVLLPCLQPQHPKILQPCISFPVPQCKVVTSIAAGAEHTVAATQDGEVGWSSACGAAATNDTELYVTCKHYIK